MKPVHLLPLGLFVLIAAALAVGLTLKPRDIPSALIGKPVPAFALAPLHESESPFTDEDLKDGKARIVNVWASWCVPCVAEHPILTDLTAAGVSVYGINYKDKPEDARLFLRRLGDPFAKIGVDPDGRTSIEWGVYGVPETFVVSGDGVIVYKTISALTRETVNSEILPLLKELNGGAE
ncbi:MAG: DsbE family thiol:disulfide interchange protein [Proteobacteria bacterium]|nr:DsbE family thiol:disulfide interchange protein [Pseudomonadota bacterium]